MKTVYLVSGSSGTYDDYRHWPVCAITTRTAAKKYCHHANFAAKFVLQEWRKGPNDPEPVITAYDPKVIWDLDGDPPTYHITKLFLLP